MADGLPVWSRITNARGTTSHCWRQYTIDQGSTGGRWWVFVEVGGLDQTVGTADSAGAAKELAYADARMRLEMN